MVKIIYIQAYFFAIYNIAAYILINFNCIIYRQIQNKNNLYINLIYTVLYMDRYIMKKK